MDPIANFLTSIRNAAVLGKTEVAVPYSRMKAAIAELLTAQGYLQDVREEQLDEVRRVLRVGLKFNGRLPAIQTVRRLSTPGHRRYVKAKDMPRPRGGFGVVIVSTPQGLMTGEQARRQRMGGELICEVLS